MPPLIFRKGLDRKLEVAEILAESYHSDLLDQIKEADFKYSDNRLTVHLAREFGFCYGVDRAVDYAYQARKRFPNRQIFLTGEIIHNPHVNNQLREQGTRFLSDHGESIDSVGPEAIVILPAFGVEIELLQQLEERHCTIVDTTCGSVLNVWKNVKRYSAEGFTSIIHGKWWHEETRATASQVISIPGGNYLIVLDYDEAAAVCDFIRYGGDAHALGERFVRSSSPGFDPEIHLGRIGCANQTTMLSSESLAVGAMFRKAIEDRYGRAELDVHYKAFDTICSATQDRQDAVIELLSNQKLDLMIVLGGYNSSNTCNLARICHERIPTYHIAEPAGLISANTIQHRTTGDTGEITTSEWLPAAGSITVGLTAGASTPDNLVESVIYRLSALANTRPGSTV
jgi:4-hydroxy-3-methylbut-2-enyl diphosphate reductase